MFTSYGKLDDEHHFGKLNSDGNDSPTVEPLRIHKPRSPKPSNIVNLSLKSGASSSEYSLHCPDYEDDNNIKNIAHHETQKHRISVLAHSGSSDILSNREEAQKKADNFPVEFSSLTRNPQLNSQTSLVENNEKYMRSQKELMPRQAPKPQDFNSINQELLPTMQGKRNPELAASQATANSRSHHIQSHHRPVSPDHEIPLTRRNKRLSSVSNRIDRAISTASISTVLASRGSPAPSVSGMDLENQSGDESKPQYRTSRIPEAGTLSSFPTHVASLAQKKNLYELRQGQCTSQSSILIPEQRNTSRHLELAENREGQKNITESLAPSRHVTETQVVGKELQKLNISSSPPPSYSTITFDTIEDMQAALNEKQNRKRVVANAAPELTTIMNPLSPLRSNHTKHPALANEVRNYIPNSLPSAQAEPTRQCRSSSPSQSVGPSSPPPLPEGWIAHLDQNSGQYYYIHLSTRATQWEFPMSPTPLNYSANSLSHRFSNHGHTYANSLSSTYGNSPLSSPGFPVQNPRYAESILSMTSQTPTTIGFTGPPSGAGVEMYKVAPSNGVYFGPYLRYTNIDIQKGIWLGSILLITDVPKPPTIHVHKSVDLSPNPRQLKPTSIYIHQRWTFYRYNLDLLMSDETSDKWTYAITSHLGCTRYEFIIAGRYETNWRFIAHSGNDFSVNTSINERTKLGGIGFMWMDILQKNTDCGGFHLQLGLGDQIYADRLWKEIPLLKQWLEISGKENRKNSPWTARHEEDVSHAYFHYYTSHYDQPYLREAFAQIPHVLQIDHHDIFDGFGSYPDHLQSSNTFENVGRIGIEMYLLFQHHTTVDILRKSNSETDLFTVKGSGWHFIKYLGPTSVVIGLDCRSERNQRQVLASPSYQGIFSRIANLPSGIQHCIWMISVPLVYPRLDTVESIAQTITTAKKGVTGTYNLLGKMTSSVAGVIGGKQAVASGFSQVKKVVGKSGLMGGILNTFGDVDFTDEPRDMWTHESKDLERTYLIRTLQGLAHQRGIRMTFLSGDVCCSGAGLFHDPSYPSNHKTMYQIISSAIVAAPAPHYLLKMLHNNKILYLPENGQKSNNNVSDTKEDMMEIFQTEANGSPRDMKKLMGRRNYVTIMIYDSEAIMGTHNGSYLVSGSKQYEQKPRKLFLAVDFIVQNDGTLTAPIKYGPVIIPNLEFGK